MKWVKKKNGAIDISRGNSSVGRAPDPHSGGQGFNSPLLHIFLHHTFASLSAPAIAIVATRGFLSKGRSSGGVVDYINIIMATKSVKKI